MLKEKRILVEHVSWIDRMRLSMQKIDYGFPDTEKAVGDMSFRDILLPEKEYARAKMIMGKEI